MVRFEDFVFWALITAIVGISLWLAFGSPEFETSAITISLFVATSAIMLWKAFFAVDKKVAVKLASIEKRTAIGFEKVRSEFRVVNLRLENLGKNVSDMKKDISSMKNNINEIKHYIKRK
jgi:hypothetical protein